MSDSNSIIEMAAANAALRRAQEARAAIHTALRESLGYTQSAAISTAASLIRDTPSATAAAIAEYGFGAVAAAAGGAALSIFWGRPDTWHLHVLSLMIEAVDQWWPHRDLIRPALQHLRPGRVVPLLRALHDADPRVARLVASHIAEATLEVQYRRGGAGNLRAVVSHTMRERWLLLQGRVAVVIPDAEDEPLAFISPEDAEDARWAALAKRRECHASQMEARQLAADLLVRVHPPSTDAVGSGQEGLRYISGQQGGRLVLPDGRSVGARGVCRMVWGDPLPIRNEWEHIVGWSAPRR